MIKSYFDDLRRKKSSDEKRNLPLRVIAYETGLSLGAIQRIRKGPLEGVRISTLDTLCGYFGVVSINNLIEYTPSKKAE